ncbi:MAG TPA: TolC family protein, partial [Bacteroidia bacterium]|nr:TolC family protein [Bacteroidia bacterium]
MQRYYSTFFLLLLAFGLRAATPDSSSAFSVSQAIEYALTHQKDVLNAQLDASIAKQQVNETIGIGLPQINGKFDVQDFVKIPTSVIPGEFFGEPAGTYIPVQFGTQWQANAGISASQLLFEPSYIIGVQASRTISELSQKNVKRSRIETAVAVYKAYYNHLLMLERKKVIDANVERVRTLRDNTKALYDNGFVEKTDADRI